MERRDTQTLLAMWGRETHGHVVCVHVSVTKHTGDRPLREGALKH